MLSYRLILAGLLLIASTAAGQSLRVAFSAKDRHTAALLRMDSVRIENLSTLRDTVINDPFIIDLEISTGMQDELPGLAHSLVMGGNFANPFCDVTTFKVTTANRGHVQLELFSISGELKADLNAELEAGAHDFSLNGASLPSGVYLLVARTGQSSSSARIVKSGVARGGRSVFVYTGMAGISTLRSLAKVRTALYRFTGYADTYYPESIEAAPLEDTTVLFDMRRVSIPPVIDRFICLNPVSFAGDTVTFEIAASSVLKSLSRIFMDFDNDGAMDDSVNASGGSSHATFRREYTAAGSYHVRACVMDLYGSTSCKYLDSAFTILDPLPLLTTAPVTEIRTTSAKSGGNITSEGRSPVSASGVCWSTSHGPTIADHKTSDGADTGGFTSNITGLEEKTTYHIRAYATNGAGTAYGNELSFRTADMNTYLPVLTTDSVTEITTSSAKCWGVITSDGGYPVTARGVCWSIAPGPTIAGANTSDGAGTGSFTSAVTGLAETTTYYIRAYATNGAGTAYGDELSFKTADPSDYLPVLTTDSVTEITPTSAMSGGYISSDGGSPVTARGVCWSASPAPTIAHGKTNDGAATGSFASSITALAANTTYYVRAYATNSYGTGYGNEFSFMTADPAAYLPVVSTTDATEVTVSSARSGGGISSDGGYPISAKGVCWSTSRNPTTLDARTNNGTGTVSFLSMITGLVANTTYYVRAFAVNSVGTGYGNEVSFTTRQGGAVESVTIGTQVWMLKNLDVDKYRNGDPIPEVTDPAQWAGLTTGAWCYYNNDPAMGAIHGRLYNWYAVNDPRGLAPEGWHVPTDEEWTVLITYLGGESVAGGKMKETGTAHWLSPNTGADNSSGFTALPSGMRSEHDGDFVTLGSYGDWWSATPSGTANAWARYIYYNITVVVRAYWSRNRGYSLRCVRD